MDVASYFLTCLLLLGLLLTLSNGCDTVRLSQESGHFPEAEGIYLQETSTCNGRPVYLQSTEHIHISNMTYWLHFYGNVEWRGWVVSRESCDDLAGIRGLGDTLWPHQIEQWQEWHGPLGWVDSEVHVICVDEHFSTTTRATPSSSSSTRVALIIVVALVIGVILGAVIAGIVFYCYRGSQRYQSDPVDRRPLVTAISSVSQDVPAAPLGDFIPPRRHLPEKSLDDASFHVYAPPSYDEAIATASSAGAAGSTFSQPCTAAHSPCSVHSHSSVY